MHDKDRETLAATHLELVERIVSAMLRRFGSLVEREDLRSFGMEGLAQAIDRWDPDRGIPFAAFARNRISGAIYDGVQQSGWLPRRAMRKVAFYRKADDLLDEAAAGPPPRDRVESAHILACRLRELAAAYATTTAAPGLPQDVADEDEPADESLARLQYCRRLHWHLDRLPEKQRDAIRFYFMDDQRLPVIAERLGCQKSWVSRLIANGLDQLRESFSRELEEERLLAPGATAPARSR
jgi:RNA polymerase sigma factor for flagellar operon FliA